MKPLGLSVTDTAKGLDVSRQSLSELLNGRNGISADMALRLEKAGWGTAELWLRNQIAYDLWRAKQHAGQIKVTKFPTPERPGLFNRADSRGKSRFPPALDQTYEDATLGREGARPSL